MTKDKELLLKDLCARLPYNVKVSIGKNKRDDILYEINTFLNSINNTYADVKPYLFPLSSMTEEQRKELDDTLVDLNLKALSDEISSEVIATYEIDFYNKNHFDYRGFIEKGLAIDATGLNIYINMMKIECYECHEVINFTEDDIIEDWYVKCPCCGEKISILP